MKFAKQFGLACLLGVAAPSVAFADDCSGRDHTTGTILGAAGGAAIGGAASHNAGGAIAGAVVGGLAGNAISRSQDCNRGDYREGRDSGYYGPHYAVGADEGDYWGVDSYDDFGADYRHIQFSIDRARERGSLSPSEAGRFSRELQQIQYQADRQQRRGRFNPQEIEDRLSQLREEMRSARLDNRDQPAFDHRGPAPYDR